MVEALSWSVTDLSLSGAGVQAFSLEFGLPCALDQMVIAAAFQDFSRQIE